MGKRAHEGQMPTRDDWNRLYGTEAYRVFIESEMWDMAEFTRNLEDAFSLAFDPARRAECDSVIASMPDSQSELPFFAKTARDISDNIERYSEMIASFDPSQAVADADSLAHQYLPDGGKDLQPERTPIYFLAWDLESRSLPMGLFMDINGFLSGGYQAGVEILGHEMHHFYMSPMMRRNYENEVEDAAVYALLLNMMEGTADMINKKEMPVKSLFPYGDYMVEIYNVDYFDSPKTLAHLDKVTTDRIAGKISEEDYEREAISCARFGGHTTGDFMVFLIRDQLGKEAAVESFCDIAKFVDNYNRAAAKAGTYTFTPEFVAHIHAQDQKMRPNP